ncbi:sulfate transporter [Bacteroides fragilis]|uniref:Sulfate transporter n=1 Tax=Bacteroides fragilis TaxID=817 RepID=A0A396C1I9_BACFG|nr:sulfate transporter [Bacteroides fragilis]RHH14439.1 sulfate transporter [Bacteroides fragilis]
MANYTFDIFKYKLVTENGKTVKSLTKKCKPLTVESTNYIAATFKAEKKYPSDKYAHKLINTDAEQWPADTSMF